METNLSVALFGATGKMGAALAKSLARGPYRLILISGESSMLKGLQSEILMHLTHAAEAEAVKSLDDTLTEPDIFILAVSGVLEAEIVSEIKRAARGKIVISMSGAKTGEGDTRHTSAEELQKLLPDSKVVKALNTITIENIKQPDYNGKQVDSGISGNDEEAVKIVGQLVRTLGFNPIIEGRLSAGGKPENR